MGLADGSYVDKLIRDAQKEGKFDNLANHGKPINTEEENPYIEEDWRLAFKVLENAGIAPAWVDLEKEVEDEIEKAKRNRLEHRRWLYRRLDDIKYGSTENFTRDLKRLYQAHQQFLKIHSKKLEDLNLKISQFNSVCPVKHLQKVNIFIPQLINDFDRECPAIPVL
jgi:Domain of unknown function (DUF1992)